LRDLFTDLDSRGIHATPRAVATALWSFANANGGAWPSQVRLARMTGRCVRTVRSAVRELEAAGVIVRQVPPLRMRRARHATTVYRLLAGDAPPFVPAALPSVPPPPRVPAELVDDAPPASPQLALIPEPPPAPALSASKVRARLVAINATGVGVRAIGEAAGVSKSSVHNFLRGGDLTPDALDALARYIETHG
jgi:hypothetical protein